MKKTKYPSKYYPINPSKYIGDASKIVLRSSWEHKFVLWLEYSPAILKWSSEEIVIDYFFELDNKWHRYFPDFFMTLKNSKGEEINYLIEIKPEKDTEVKQPKKITEKAKANMINQVITMEKNKAKWLAASKWCKERGIEFKILTEKGIYGEKNEEHGLFG